MFWRHHTPYLQLQLILESSLLTLIFVYSPHPPTCKLVNRRFYPPACSSGTQVPVLVMSAPAFTVLPAYNLQRIIEHSLIRYNRAYTCGSSVETLMKTP